MPDNPWDDLNHRATIATRTSPGIASSPGIVYAAAQQYDPSAAARAAEAFKWGYETMDHLRQLDPTAQRSQWQSFTADQQRMLQEGMGYKVPPAEKHQGWWQKALGWVNPVGPIVHGGEDILNALGAPLRGVQHIVRSAFELGRANPQGVAPVWSFQAWSAAWDKTKDGERYIPEFDSMMSEFKSALPQEAWPIARDMAAGDNLNMLIGKYGPDAVAAATTNPDWERSLQIANASKVSLGRLLVHRTGYLKALGGPGAKSVIIPEIKIGENTVIKGISTDWGNFYSGTIDAVADFYGDPVNIVAPAVGATLRGGVQAGLDTSVDILRYGPKTAREIAANRFAVRSAEDIDRLQNYATVRRAQRDIVSNVTAEGKLDLGKVMTRYQKLQPLAEPMEEWFRNRAPTEENLVDFFRGQAGLSAYMEGKVPRYLKPYSDSVRLTAFGKVVKGAKATTTEALDDLSNLPSKTFPGTKVELNALRRTGRFLKQFSTLYERTPSFDPEGPEAVKHLYQVARLALPEERAQDYIRLWTAGDIGGKRDLYLGLHHEVFAALGSDWIPESGLAPKTLMGKYHQLTVGAVGEDLAGRPYGWNKAGDDVSRVARLGGDPVNVGLFEHQITQQWAIPNIKNIARASKAETRLAQVFGGPDKIPTAVLNRFVEGYWKPAILLRLAFGLRVGGEETARAVAEHGFLPTVKSRIGLTAAKRASYLEWADMTEASAPLREHIANQMTRFGQKARIAIAGEESYAAANRLYERHGNTLVPGEVRAHRGKDLDTPEALNEHMKDWMGKPLPVRMAPTGRWKGVTGADPANAIWWQRELARHVGDDIFQVALSGDREEVAALLGSDAKKALRSRAAIMKAFDTEEEAISEWSRRATEAAHGLVQSPNGQFLEDLAASMRDGKVPELEVLEKLAAEGKAPLFFSAPELKPVPRDFFSTMVSKGFEKFVDPQIDYIARQPIFHGEFVLARRQIRTEVERLKSLGVKDAERIGDDWAEHVAIQRMLPNIHNPEVRSQWEQMHSSVFPFWFAQRQFFERWGRTIAKDPSFIRRAQLLMMGLRHSGVIRKDDNGEDVFQYPGVGFLQQGLFNAASLLTGGNLSLPIPIEATGRVQFLVPGAERIAMPGAGPFLGFSLGVMRKLWPEYGAPAERAVLGERGAGRDLWEYFAPSSVVNTYKALVAAPEHEAQLSSAMFQAMAMLEHSGHGLSETADEMEKEVYLDRVRKWARTMLFTRAVFGYTLPTAPNFEFVGNLRPELMDLMKALPLEEAMAEFIRRNPDATPFTVFQSKTLPGSSKPLSVDDQAAKFLSKNGDFIRRYKAAASWFIPGGEGEFSDVAYRQEIAMGLRRRKAPEEFWKDLKLAADGDEFYSSQDSYYKALDSTDDANVRRAVKTKWSEYRDAYLASHPLFAQHRAEAESRSQERLTTLGRLSEALSDPDAPKTPDAAGFRDVLGSFSTYRDVMASLRYKNDQRSRLLRKNATAVMIRYGQGLTGRSLSLYRSLIQPELPQDAVEEILGAAA